jgi:uncharacterized protein YbjQ (UPF0145 family)
MTRMQTEAEALDAKGIVGVQIRETNHVWSTHVIEFLAIGTAIVDADESQTADVPIAVLDLS